MINTRQPKRILFIVNPFAGYKSKKDYPDMIRKALLDTDWQFDIERTQYAGHAAELAHAAKDQQYDAVVAAGGDGTVNEVAAQLVNSGIIMGIVPGGSGNGLSGHLGLGRNPQKALEILKKWNVEPMDTAEVNGRPYVNMAGVGIDGLVAYKTKSSAKRGFQTYLKGAVWEGIKYKNQHYTVETPEKEYDGKFLSINVANGSMFGYNFTIAADADTSDGLVNTLMIHDAHKIDYFGNAWRFWARRIHKSKLASTDLVDYIKLTCHEPSYLHIDGEGYPCEAGVYEFRVRPNSLLVIANPTRKRGKTRNEH